jgi:hypothetical protein
MQLQNLRVVLDIAVAGPYFLFLIVATMAMKSKNSGKPMQSNPPKVRRTIDCSN